MWCINVCIETEIYLFTISPHKFFRFEEGLRRIDKRKEDTMNFYTEVTATLQLTDNRYSVPSGLFYEQNKFCKKSNLLEIFIDFIIS